MKKRVTFKALGAPITVVQKALPANRWGHFDERNGEIAIESDQPEFGKLVILLHESMHVVETMLIQGKRMKRRVPHEFVTSAAFALATILVHAGAAGDISPRDWRAFVKADVDRKSDRPVRRDS